MPVLLDGQQPVFDSWQIAAYLDRQSGNTSLLGDEKGASQAFVAAQLHDPRHQTVVH